MVAHKTTQGRIITQGRQSPGGKAELTASRKFYRKRRNLSQFQGQI